LFDPPEVTAGSLLVDFDPAASTADMSVTLGDESFTATTHLDGFAYVDVPRACQGPLPNDGVENCGVSLSLLRLAATDTITIKDTQIAGTRVQVPQPLAGDILTVGDTSLIILSMDVPLYVTAGVQDFGPAQSAFTPPEGLAAAIDWTTRQFQLGGILADPNGTSILSVLLEGSLPNLKPTADSGEDQIVECQGPGDQTVVLSALGSTDPDGAGDLASFVWTSNPFGLLREGGGVTLETTAPFGLTTFTLMVTDASSVSDIDTVDVLVEDTTPPELQQINLATNCLWPPNHTMHLFRLGQELEVSAFDLCDVAPPEIKIINVVSNQPAEGPSFGDTSPDVVFGSGAFCIRAEHSGNQAREYTVTLQARDQYGNASQADVVVRVPRGQGQAGTCLTGAAAPVVEDMDPRCQTSIEALAGTAFSLQP
jgi:hypothetical protein